MSFISNPQKLYIPRKNTRPKGKDLNQNDADINWRAIENWANGLKAGSSIGGLGFQIAPAVSTGPLAIWGGSGAIGFTGTTTPQITFPMFAGNVGYPPGDFITSTIVEMGLGGGGWLYVPATAGSRIISGTVSFLAPQFTGPSSTIQAHIGISAVAVTGTAPASNSFVVNSHTIALTSGQVHSLGATDYFTATINGADLTFTSGVLRSTSGTIPYAVGWDVFAVWDTANTFG